MSSGGYSWSIDVFHWRAGRFCLELLNNLAQMFGGNGLKPVLLANLCFTYCYVFFLKSSAPKMLGKE
jgi:hypothetical protein